MRAPDPVITFIVVLVIALIGYHIAVLLAVGGGIVTSAIAAALGAVVGTSGFGTKRT